MSGKNHTFEKKEREETEKKEREEREKKEREENEKKEREETEKKEREEREKREREENEKKERELKEKKEREEREKKEREEMEKKEREEREKKEKEKEEYSEKEEYKRMGMCSRCLDVGEEVHNAIDCENEEVINAGYKLAFATESPNLLKLLKEIESTEEEKCPVCGGNDCEDPYQCLKQARFVMEGEDFKIEIVERCEKCGKKHPYDVPKDCRE